MTSVESIVAEARAMQEGDLERAKAALQAANACGNFDGVTYRIARVDLDVPPPLAMIVDVKSSDLEGARLAEPPPVAEVYVPPEERGATPREQASAAVETWEELKAARERPEFEELGEHVFPADPRALARCEACGCTLEEAEAQRRCGGS